MMDPVTFATVPFIAWAAYLVIRALRTGVFVLLLALAASPALAQQADGAICAARPLKAAMPAPIIVHRIASLFPRAFRPTADGNVLQTQDRTVTLSLGAQDGLTPRASGEIFLEGREVRHPRTGEVLGHLEQTVAQVVVEEVFQGYATVRLIDRSTDVRAGDRARLRLEKRKFPLSVIPLVESETNALEEAAMQELVESLDNEGRFQLSIGGPMALALLQTGLPLEKMFEGKGLPEMAKRFKVEDVLLVHVKSLQGKPYIDVRLFWFRDDPRVWRHLAFLRRPCVSITGDVAGQARFDADQRACDGGDARRCSAPGALYEQGSGETETWPWYGDGLPLAVEFYRLGCLGGDAAGCRKLGSMYRRGVDGSKRPPRAARFYRRACDLGDAEGCASLAEMYETGTGVTLDAQRTHDLYRRACDLGALHVCGP